MNDEKLIRKLYGEKMWHLCRELFPTILEKPGLLIKILNEHFNPCRYLYEDIVKNNLQEDFKDYIYSFVDVLIRKKVKTSYSVEELFNMAGYDFYECHSESDIQSFRHYYRPDEELCTFTFGNRLKRCHVFFAVKKNVDEILRENFDNPVREDEYGTSVISIQFTRGKRNTLSIKNRYNHRVNNPDATFHNNLDNIISGLTDAFEENYNLKINQNRDSMFELDDFGYVYADDGKWYKYNFEIDNIYYCPDNIIIDDYIVKSFPKEKYIIFDCYILDLVTKEIYLYDEEMYDCFIKQIGVINKVTINKCGLNKQVLINLDNGYIELILNNKNQLIGYKDNISKNISMNFLGFSIHLLTLSLFEAENIEEYSFESGHYLKELIIPKVKKIGDFCFVYSKLEKLYCPQLKTIGYKSLNKSMDKVYENVDKDDLLVDELLRKGRKV